jgi:hypothetical protein
MMTDIPLDIQVAQVVFKADVIQARNEAWGYRYGDAQDVIDTPSIPSYSTDISAAWLVVERLVALLPNHDLHLETLGGSGWKVGCCFSEAFGWEHWVEGDTLPKAVCLAALNVFRNGEDHA